MYLKLLLLGMTLAFASAFPTEGPQEPISCTVGGNECDVLINSECDPERSQCVCPISYPILDAENSHCVRHAGLTERCQFSSECEDWDEFTFCGPESICICVAGFKLKEFPSIGPACVKETLPSEPPATEEVSLREPECTNGSRWRKDCNRCRCSEEGLALCTKKRCFVPVAEGTPECENGSRFRRDCNWCDCVDGTAICTTQHCDGDNPSSTHRASASRGKQLSVPLTPECEGEPSQGRWRQSCNWCRCLNGLGVCDRRGCPAGEEGRLENTPECTGTVSWMRDCNRCHCVNDRAVCETNFCGTPPTEAPPTVEVSLTEPECTNGSRWRKECNWCNCNEKGLGFCSKKGCFEPVAEGTPECEDGSRFRRDCNWCDCVDGTAICTTQHCDGGNLPRMEPECIAGSRWRKECNWCNCNDRGLGLCSKKRCFEPEPEGTPECEDGSRFRRDCNWCNCVNGTAICTTQHCNVRKTGDPASQCEEGTITQERCNTCQCINGLRRCTERACEPECNEGDIWTSDCNECRCLKGEPSCTRKLCPTQGEVVRPSRCNLPPIDSSVESCGGFESKWTFDSEANQCKEIVYGGCGGTENLYDSGADCRHACPVPETRGREPQAMEDRCFKPKDRGPCFAALERYYFNTETNQCERFEYGGCQGNDNKFMTFEECSEACGTARRLSVLSTPTEEPICDESKCPWQRYAHYTAKNCLPQYKEGACCPSSFYCPSLDQVASDPSRCYYKGEAYEVGDSVSVEDPCSANCYCAGPPNLGTDVEPAQPAEVRCANIECPGFFRPPRPGCRSLYRLDQCCSYDEVCADPNNDTPAVDNSTVTCDSEGRTYLEGDRMYFKDFPCQKCVCSADFTDPNGLGCMKINCGFDFRYSSRFADGCVPIFFESKCCPVDWLCPDDDRMVVEEHGGRGDQEYLGRDAGGEDTNVNVCLLPKDTGPCRAALRRIYFDVEVSECLQFLYGGCQGNGNNFRSHEECHQSCSKTPKPSESECILGGETPRGPSPPRNVWVTGVLDHMFPGKLSLQVGWTPAECPYGEIVAYWVLYHESSPDDEEEGDFEEDVEEDLDEDSEESVEVDSEEEEPQQQLEWTKRRIEGNLRTHLIFNGLDAHKSYVVGVVAQNTHAHSEMSRHVVFSLTTSGSPAACHLGDRGLTLGETLNLTNCHIKCKCVVPPEVTCVQYRSCELAETVQFEEECAEVQCAPGCHIVNRAANCPTCYCPAHPSTCEVKRCPSTCETITDVNTGCPSCKCDCPQDLLVQPPCPMDCAVHFVYDEATGCQKCECDPKNPWNPFGPGPQQRDICPKDHTGRAPCPMDCAVYRYIDQETGCEKCECDPNNRGTPFGPGPQQRDICPKDHTGRAPCPMDCAVHRYIDQETGCEKCECDPNNPRNPFGPDPPQRQICPKDHTGRAPCPMDCAVYRYTDQETGCEKCECDPNKSGNPFVPY